MTSATLKCKVTRADMFYCCLGLTTVVFSDDIINIPGYMFGYSKQLADVTVKAGTWKVNQKDYQTDANGKLPAAAVNFMIRNYGAAFVG